MGKQIEISIHASNDDLDVRQASATVDIPETCYPETNYEEGIALDEEGSQVEREMAELLARSIAEMMSNLWSGYRVTASATVVKTTREVVSHGDVRLP